MVFISSLFPVISALSPTTTPPVTTFPVNAVNAKDLGVRSYGDYLAAGRTNTYYFDVNSYDNANYNLIKVFTQTKSGHLVTMTVGFNYVPSSENNRYDFIASTSSTSSDAVIQINQPKSGRYYVTVKGIAGSGDTKVSRTWY